MRFEMLKVGELARRTGLTVRTLHHYDAIGLLRPSLRTESGQRLYSAGDVARLHQVISLRQLGFSLAEVRDCLQRSSFSPREVIRLHIARLREQMAHQERLCRRLDAVAARLSAAEEVSADEFLQIIEEMTMLENYYTPEQWEFLKQRREAVGEERMKQAPADWAELIAQVRAEQAKGIDPADPKVQELARRWRALIAEFTGGDPRIEQSLGRLWKERGDDLVGQYGAQYEVRDLSDYIGRAMEIAKGSS
jgi:DNA-binding transcriptional MerR regulator